MTELGELNRSGFLPNLIPYATSKQMLLRMLFEMEGAGLEFTPESLREIARKAKERDTGARGLRSIVEELMTDIMFELPDIETKTTYTVTDAVVRGEVRLFEKKALPPEPIQKSA